MRDSQRLPCLAVLIDGENISSDLADGLFREIAKFGDARLRRIYGNFDRPQLKTCWDGAIKKYAIDRVNVPNTTKGKNATDIALVIDAVDLLHIGRFDGFCLVSSDSDFTGLAMLFRARGIDAFGFGEQKTPESLRQAYHRFYYIENLSSNVQKLAIPRTDKSLNRAVQILSSAVSRIESEDGWVLLSHVGTQARNLVSDFDSRNFGYRKLSDLIEASGIFKTKKIDDTHIWIRVKSDSKDATTKAA